ncbi:MAG: MerR family DNA-binding transcriptional regulator [Bacteroidales bacterium]|nr:MerR family DNA-binding transcriptional regulator [Candidatus Cryptobacteroides onthequi]
MEKTKYKTGEFSKLARVTVRTLRHYEDLGLLKPDIVDRWTGYRYYSPGQLQKLRVWLQDSIKRRLQHRGIRKFSVCPRPLDGHPEAEKIKS